MNTSAEGAAAPTAAPRPSSPQPDGGDMTPATLLPVPGLKQVDQEMLTIGEMLGVSARTVTAQSDPRVAYTPDERSLATLTATAFEVNDEVAPLAQVLDLAPDKVHDALDRQAAAKSGYEVAQGILTDSRLWQQVEDATLFLSRYQVRAEAMKMLSDGTLDEAGQQELQEDLQEVLDLEGWTLQMQQQHQAQLARLMETGTGEAANVAERRKLMQVLATLRDGKEPDLADLIEAAGLYQKYLAQAQAEVEMGTGEAAAAAENRQTQRGG